MPCPSFVVTISRLVSVCVSIHSALERHGQKAQLFVLRFNRGCRERPRGEEPGRTARCMEAKEDGLSHHPLVS